MVKGCLFSPPPLLPLTHPHVSKQQINNISFGKSKLFNVFIGHCQPIVNNCRKITVKSIKLPYQSQNWPRILNIPKIIYALNASNTNGLIFTKILKPSSASLEKPLSSLYTTCLLDLKKLHAGTCPCMYHVRKSSSTYTKKRAWQILKFLSFQRSLKDILQKCFITALLKILLQFICSFLESQQVRVFTFPSCYCLNAPLDWIDWSLYFCYNL